MNEMQELLINQARRLAIALADQLTGPLHDQADILVALLYAAMDREVSAPRRIYSGGGPDAA